MPRKRSHNRLQKPNKHFIQSLFNIIVRFLSVKFTFCDDSLDLKLDGTKFDILPNEVIVCFPCLADVAERRSKNICHYKKVVLWETSLEAFVVEFLKFKAVVWHVQCFIRNDNAAIL